MNSKTDFQFYFFTSSKRNINALNFSVYLVSFEKNGKVVVVRLHRGKIFLYY
jgi:hypothetical protein